MGDINSVTFEELSALTETELLSYFGKYNKEDLKLFADKHELPYKKSYSSKQMVSHLSKEIALTGVFMRIAEGKN